MRVLKSVRTVVLWTSGLIACGLLTSFLVTAGSDGLTGDRPFWGFIAGALAFICARLWFAERPSKS